MNMVRVLSIDGGGIRGVIPAQVLVRIEELLVEFSGDKDARISDFFDLIAGTSTGGIISALCVCPSADNPLKARYTAKEILKMYEENGRSIFTRSVKTKTYDYFGLFNPIYQKDNLEKILQDYFGEVRLSETVKPCLIPSYDLQSGKAVFFSKLLLDFGSEDDLSLKDVVRATSAAPTYFPVKECDPAAFIDGGLFANNPALCAYVEATKFPSGPQSRDIMLLSLGTGSIGSTYPYKEAKKWGRLNWIIPVINIYGSAASQVVDHQLHRIYAEKELGSNYLRLEADLSKHAASKAMDDASPKNIRHLMEVGNDLVKDNEGLLREFVKKIVSSQETSRHRDLYRKRNRG